MSRARTASRMLLVPTLFFAAVGSASVSFRAAVNYAVGSQPSFVATGDFNGDRKPDLVVVSAGDPNANDPGGISILLGNGDGTFQSAMNFSAGNNPGSVAVADFSGDGKDDLAVQRPGNGGSDSGDVTILMSNGDGTFTKGQVITSAVSPSAVAMGDFDSDGKLDLVIFNEAFGSVVVLLGNGDGTFSGPKSYSTPLTPVGRKLEVLDFNRDGKKDIAVTGFPGGGSILIGNGNGTFQADTSLGSFATFDTIEFVADFNHDGNIDAILNHCVIGGWPPHSHCTEQVLLNNGDATFSTPPGAIGFSSGTSISGDFDGDGNLDLAGTQSSNNTLQGAIFRGNGDGTFQQPATFSASASFHAVAVAADLNGDGASDLVTTNVDNTISVILNSGTDFSLFAGPLNPNSIGPGTSATSTVSLQLLSLFHNPVSLTCSVQPAQPGAPSCSLSAKSVSFDSSGTATATLTISAAPVATLENDLRVNLGAASWLPIAGFAFFGTAARFGRRSKHAAVFIAGLIALLSVILLPGCGGGSGSKPASTNYTITIAGTSGQTSHTTSVNLTMN